MNTSRPGRSRRSAELHSAVSRICNPPRVATGVALPTASRRYSRLQICATGFGQFDKYFAQAEKTFMAGITTLDWGVRNAEYRTIPSPPRASLQEPARPPPPPPPPPRGGGGGRAGGGGGQMVFFPLPGGGG